MENAHDKLEGKRLTQNVYMCLLTENKDGFGKFGRENMMIMNLDMSVAVISSRSFGGKE